MLSMLLGICCFGSVAEGSLEGESSVEFEEVLVRQRQEPRSAQGDPAWINSLPHQVGQTLKPTGHASAGLDTSGHFSGPVHTELSGRNGIGCPLTL